ncbi:DNA polymerase [Niastella sp. OAS944]|uniref:DNA polymerase n=1 Tax=Niastella sp. OAS944 TaxID=2664089 RepID=UPI0035C80646
MAVDLETVKKRCEELESYIYEIKNTLQVEHEIFTPDCIETQKNYLRKKAYSIVESLLYSFKIRRKSDIVCNLFYDLLSNQRDLDSLLLMLSRWGQTRTHPTYLGFGTITSRIILRQPSLQNLRKSNRDLIIPDIGTKLIYIDYGQFEAGILASLSNDKHLIKLYDSDIYSDIAEKVLNNKEDRNEAKIIFYRFIYGDTTLPKNAIDYFHRFKGLQNFKMSIENKVLLNNKVGTVNGNYRRSFDNDISWALSHVIQSTASYIYKSALIKVDQEVKTAQLLIPMHDGTVYQLKQFNFDESKNKIEAIYKDEFKKMCPQLNPIVKIKDSFE